MIFYCFVLQNLHTALLYYNEITFDIVCLVISAIRTEENCYPSTNRTISSANWNISV